MNILSNTWYDITCQFTSITDLNVHLLLLRVLDKKPKSNLNILALFLH